MTNGKKMEMDQLEVVAGGARVCERIPWRANIEQTAMRNQLRRIPWLAKKTDSNG